MNFLGFFSPSSSENASSIPEIYSLALKSKEFVETDVFNTYVKILTDTVERTHGLKKELEPLLWDNCVRGESGHGLISLIAHAMAHKADLFLVYKKEAGKTGVLRKATDEEKSQIEADYKAKAESKVGVWLSFKNYRRTDILQVYSEFEYCVLASLNKSLNVSKALQLKFKELRASTALSDSAEAVKQAKDIADALRKGNDVMVDSEDEISTTSPDTTQAEKSIAFLDAKRAFYLNLPISYISGLQTPGIGSTGEADMRAVERGLKQYFVSIIRPVFKAVFEADAEFKSQDFRLIDTGLNALKTFSLVMGDDLMAKKTMQRVTCQLFNLDFDEETKALEQEASEPDPQEQEPKNPRPLNLQEGGDANAER